MRLFANILDSIPSFGELVMPHMQQLHRLAYHYTGQQSDAEDLVQDLQQGSSFTSYSATRHAFAASLKQPINRKWTGRADLNYRISNYNDAKIVTGISQGARQDNRTRVTLKGIYHYSQNIEIEGMLRRTDNSSNVGSSDYSNTITQLSLNMDF